MGFHVFHTNDFHNRLTEAGERRIREAVAAVGDDPWLLLDAGDAVKAGNLGVTPGGEPILRRMTDMGYAAMTIGNRETHPSRLLFGSKTADAGFPLLCANVRPRRGGPLPVVPHVELVRAGVRIAVFGVTVPMVTERQAVKAAWDMVFDDPVQTAARIVESLRPNCDLLIALTHVGHATDRRIAEAGLPVDAIVSGHTHLVLEQPICVGGIPIVQAGSHGRFLGHMRWDDPASFDYRLLPLGDPS